MSDKRCGVYAIRCNKSGNIYIGSSKQILVRWAQHRKSLRSGTSGCIRLQFAWRKHGEEFFQFFILEECDVHKLEEREQFYIDALKPKYNMLTRVRERMGSVPRAKIAAAVRARAALITHCPRGHEYDIANTYINKKGKRICRACNAERVGRVIAAESEEQRAVRIQRNNDSYYQKYEHNRAKQLEYSKTRREQKREYDQMHRAEARERRRYLHANETPERHAERLYLKRESYHRNHHG